MSLTKSEELQLLKINHLVVVRDIKRKMRDATENSWTNDWFVETMRANFSDLKSYNKRMEELYTELDKEINVEQNI